MGIKRIHNLTRNVFYQQIMSYHKVFVYGTLKKGEPNHGWLTTKENGHAKFLGKAKTVKKYPLIIASKYNIPFLLDRPGTGENIVGELYEIDDKMLGRLDVLEDHPSFYIREKEDIEIIEESPGEIFSSWVYFLKKFKPELLSEEYLTEYHSNGPHGKPYTERYLRDPEYHARMDVLIN